MIPITATKIAKIVGGKLSIPTDATVSGVVINSREASSGSLFCAIRGEKSDGHDYISAATENGAVCALVTRVPDGVTSPVIVVQNVEMAIKTLAEHYRSTLNLPIIGVTGSVGKTTTKEMIAAVLAEKFNVHKTFENKNNELGVPLTLFAIEREHSAAVVEMGISDFGEMRRLTKMVRPDIAVFTSIGHSHLQMLSNRRGVLRAKSEILEGMARDGIVIVNGDDDLLTEMQCLQRKISYGMGDSCAVRAEGIVINGEDGISCNIIRGARELRVTVSGFGEHLVYAALAASAVGFELGLTDEQIVTGLANYKTVGGRAMLQKTRSLTLVNDCYNSNPTSCASSLRSMFWLTGRRVVILGDMLELGENAPTFHYEIGVLAKKLGIELLLCTGELSRHTADGAGDIARYFSSKQALINALPMLLHPTDVVLVKASHSMHFEEIVEHIACFY